MITDGKNSDYLAAKWGHGGAKGEPSPSPWWHGLIWIIILLLFAFVIWILVKGSKRTKKKKIKKPKSKGDN